MPILLEQDRQRPLPPMYRVRQRFAAGKLEDPGAETRRQLRRPEIAGRVRPGMRVAVAVGSRGIRNLFAIVQAVVEGLLALGAQPFVVSAMGSHGGGTQAGQREVLAGYGITQQRLHVPVVTTVVSRKLGSVRGGVPVYFDEAALEADLVVPVNRVKPHTDFIGDLQSGLCKMLVIGLGNQIGCSAIHEEDPRRFAGILEDAAGLILHRANIGFGVAILENGYDQTAAVEAVPAERLIAREKELVKAALRNMPRLMVPKMDVLVMREMGKDISGAGYDPNIVGRSSVRDEFAVPVPEIERMVLLDLTDASHGNGIGVGLFDAITRRVYEKLDLASMYANAVACKCIDDVKIPLVAADEEEAVRVALQTCRGLDWEGLRIVRIQNTLALEWIEVSGALLPAVEKNPLLSLEGPAPGIGQADAEEG